MSKCKKVKNPCKICLAPVSQKNGLQCQGVCESWVHYSCLNYTPGKIRDIKSGIIKVACPCPDCKTTQPKEFRTDSTGYSCNNNQCPANKPPICEIKTCPANEQCPAGADLSQATQACPLGQCGAECKKHSYSPVASQKPSCQTNMSGTTTHQGMTHQANYATYNVTSSSSSSACVTPPFYDIAGDMRHVYSVPSMSVVEEMCNTVGQLTHQINDLMSKMKQAVNLKGPGCYPREHKRTCGEKGPRSKCPKPCYCPGNPVRKKQIDRN